MSKKMLVNAAQAGEVRVAIVDEGILEELNVAFEGSEQIRGNIYRARVVTVEPGLQAAFVDYGAERNGFITFNDINARFYNRTFTGKGRPRIQDVLAPGAEMLVQAYKEEVGNKGAALTTDITLPGRYLVIMPHSATGGVSRKIQDEETRKRLKDLIEKLEPPEDMGIIVRTAGEERSKKELQADFQELVRVWGHIQVRYNQARQTGLVYREPNVVIRSVRDYYTDDVDEVVVDDADLHRQVLDFFERHIPDDTGKVKHYTGKMPIFSNFGLERQLENISSHRVPLRSGGSIVVNPTEALTAIDVNSGKSRGQSSQEQMAYETNKEAAEEVARQLRLRDLGGLVVVDFIDMSDSKHRRDVERTLKKAMKRDKARVELGRISQFGLLELSRQRIKARLLASTHRVCPMCDGSGYVMSTEATAMGMLRRLQELAVSSARGSVVRGRLPVPVALHLLNFHRASIAELEERFEVTIELIPEIGAISTREAFEVSAPNQGEKREEARGGRRGDRREGRDGREGRENRRQAQPSRPRRPENVPDIPPPEDDEPFEPPRILGFMAPEELAAADLGPEDVQAPADAAQLEAPEEDADEAEAGEAAQDEGDDGRRRRRRRRRRRGRGGDEASGA
ncbi:MAG: Rne/Rng family ribonuclease, partial [Myxococcales bacterium]|nr:Rne/Rng family ribonuclease [Myxococcales bacterium]